MISVEKMIKLLIQKVPYVMLLVWKHNANWDERSYDFLGMSVGQIPLKKKVEADLEDLILVGTNRYKLISFLGKVLTVLVTILLVAYCVFSLYLMQIQISFRVDSVWYGKWPI